MGTVQQLFPRFRDGIAVRDVYADLDWAPRGDRPLVALNMVSSVDGRATINGHAAGIGGPVDQALMPALRANADALLHGAGTVRSDRIGKGVPDDWVPYRTAHGLSPQPLLTIITATGNVPLDRAVFAQPERVVVFVAAKTPPGAVARLRERATVRVVGDEQPDPAEAMRVLRADYGVRHVLCEGGPTLNRSLAIAGVLDELFLTLAPSWLGGDGLPLVVGDKLIPPLRLTLRTLFAHESELYLRYAITQ